jgi:restriction system protein
MKEIPKSQELLIPTLRVLSNGETLSNVQIRSEVGKLLQIPNETMNLIHSGSRTELEYRLAWARTRARNDGLIESPNRSHWKITDKGREFLRS